MLHQEDLSYISEIIKTKLINMNYDNPLAGHIEIKKICKLVTWKYYWPILQHDIEIYIKGYKVCLVSKAIRYKLYGNL